MRKASILLGSALLLAAAPMAARGQVRLGPTLAWHDDADIGIGATVGFELDGNVTYDFPLAESTVLPCALAGLNIGDGTSFVLLMTLPFRVGAR